MKLKQEDITQEFVEALKIDEVKILTKVAEDLSIKVAQVSAVIELMAEGATVPFISRYRKERTGNLDEVQVRDSGHKFESYKNLETRRLEVIKGIFELGKLSPELYTDLQKATTLTAIEDIWLPYKKKKKTRGMLAEEKGLGPLAEIMLAQNEAAVEKAAPDFVREVPETPTLSVASAADAIAGAMDIIAERVAQNPDNRALVKKEYFAHGELVTTGVDEKKKESSTYQMYYEYAEPLSTLKPHRLLAVNRGEREGELNVTIKVDEEAAIAALKDVATINNKYHAEAIADGLVRLLSPAVIREIRSDAGESADNHGISIFSENLKNLLMQPPLKGTRVLGLDPGIRTGTKCAVLDETGKFLEYFMINQERAAEEAKKLLSAAITKHKIQLIAIGNGTASHEVQELVAAVVADLKDCEFTVVDEDGASVYSASDLAREEFPELDLTIRGAISIGRRLQDPLAELVKIDPKSIGVGLYQHDLNQKKLSEGLDEVVGSVVNRVGVNLNTASHALLKYVSGINFGLAKKIVKYRETNGAISNREQLKKIPGLGEKTFEQCAGFLKIPESSNPLDNTWVHPENYALAGEIFPIIQAGREPSHDERASLKQKYNVGETTLDDLITELKKPNRDPREAFPKPILQKGILKFEDLKEGMIVKGKVKNVVDFGAFIDIGIKESALIHISEMSDHFIKDPMEALKVGDVKDFRIISLDEARRRIGLSLKSGEGHQHREHGGGHGANKVHSSGEKTASTGPKRVLLVKKAGAADGAQKTSGDKSGQHAGGGHHHGGQHQGGRPQHTEKSYEKRKPMPSDRDNDGTKYNPFADLLKGKK